MRSYRPLLALAAIAAIVVGCTPTKNVTIITEPAGAEVTLLKVEGGSETAVDLGSKRASPLEKTLDFDPAKKTTYRVVASKAQFLDGQDVIRLEPADQKQYTLKLRRFMADVPTFRVEPRMASDAPVVAPELITTEAILDEAEPSPNIVAASCVAQPSSLEYLDFSGLAASPTGNSIVFQCVQEKQKEKKHTVTESKQTLQDIATQYNTTVVELIRLNGPLANPLKEDATIKVADSVFVSSIIKQDGARFSPITAFDSLDLYPSFFFGETIIFSSNRIGSTNSLWKVAADGSRSAFTSITSRQSNDYYPAGTPDGKMICYASVPTGSHSMQVWLVAATGVQPQQLVSGEAPNVSLENSIVYLARDKASGMRQLWRMNLDASNRQQLTQNTKYDIATPKWSPNGKWIVFAANQGIDKNPKRMCQNWDIWVMSAETGKQYQLTTNGSWDDEPCWDRTGEYVYFRSNRGGKWKIWRLQPDFAKMSSGG